jgi:acyl phosphate:glycerol-3-phosphate acyltransferase
MIKRWPVFEEQWPMLVFSVMVAAMVIFRHRANLARLRAGIEPRFAQRP